MTLTLPAPRPLPVGPSLRWGVMAPGGIAGRFVTALHAHTTQRVAAIGSRSLERAQEFAGRHGAERSYGSYEALAADPAIDVVYVASPHSEHARLALLAIAAGKHVLIEKPFAASEEEASTIAEHARSGGVLAMEAMWTRYLPQADIVRQLLADGAVGDIELVTADFGFQLPFDPHSRIYDPDLAGGALLDAGVYPLSFVSSVLGAPRDLVARGTLAPTGVESKATILLTYRDSPAHGVAMTATTASYPVTATIAGSGGRIDVLRPFIATSGVRLSGAGWGRDADVAEWHDTRYSGVYDAMHYEADALATYVGEGRTESPIHPLDETVSIIATIDETRRQIGTLP
jgi:predicted dehydrogenase